MGDDERHSQAGGIFGVIPPLSSSGRSRQVGGVNGGIVSSSGNDLRTNKPRFRRSRLACPAETAYADRKSTRLNSSHLVISYAVFCLKKKKKTIILDGD